MKNDDDDAAAAASVIGDQCMYSFPGFFNRSRVNSSKHRQFSDDR
jgi:hypothetical protein